MAVRHALEHVLEVGVGFDPVELCGGEKRGDDGPSIRAGACLAAWTGSTGYGSLAPSLSAT
jgi:hypothetical protein